MFNFTTKAQLMFVGLLARAHTAVLEGRLSVPRYMAAQTAARLRVERAFPDDCYQI